MKEKIKNEKGITLIALVITIIILLILAGVTINVAIGDNGLFRKSQNAVERYKSAEANETKVLDEMASEINRVAKAEILSKVTGEETENTEVTIAGEKVVVPAGFTISEDTAETVKDGIVVEDKNGNEWVWVPCTEAEFKRTAFKGEDITTKYTEEETEGITNQKASVTKNKGYYIGRYEAGNDGSGNVILQKNKTPYNRISIADCKTKSNNFASANEYNEEKMFTTLCSSYAWDSALTFIEKTNSGYATNSTQGNYSDTDFVSGYSLINTGLTTAVSNIYDMGGNLWEYTTESCSGENDPYVERGGSYGSGASGGPAGFRGGGGGSANSFCGFRPTLFLK